AHHPAVASAAPDLLLPHEARVVFDDPRYPSQWYMERLGMDAPFARSLGSPDVPVAVMVSAIDLAHLDLSEACDARYDAFDGDDDPSPNPGEFCHDGSNGLCDSHGTSVAGIVGARAGNGVGMVGFCPTCRMIPIKMLGEGEGALSRDVAAFEHAL